MTPLDPRLPNSKTGSGDQPATETGKSRREFLATATAVSAMSLVGGSLGVDNAKAAPLDGPQGESGFGANWSVDAVRIEQTFGDSSVVPFFRFVSVNGTPSAGALPLLEGQTGRLAKLTLTNQLDFPVQPSIVGYQTGPVVNPGQSVVWAFRMPGVGTWLLTDALLGVAAGPVGFGATVISQPRPSLRTSFSEFSIRGTQYDQEYVLLYQDADDLWNFAVDAGNAPDTSVYEPNYHTLNGLTFPQTASDPDTRINCQLGDLVLLRMGNLGHVRHAVHFHGYHADMIYRDNVLETSLPPKDTFPLPGHTTAEIALPVVQGGVFPIHPHSLTSTTDNGTYPFGQITLIDASV